MTSLEEVRQRKLFQWGLGYLGGAWVLLQVLATFADLYEWPPIVLRVVPVLLAAGFAATLVLAWCHGERGSQRIGWGEGALLLGVLFAGGIGVVLVTRGGTVAEGQPLEAPGGTGPAGAPDERAAVAVLPFRNVSSDPGQAYFSDGLSEELISVLSRVPGLRVAARTSSFAFRDADVTIDSIARALRVGHVVEGSVRRVGDRVRISAQLVEAGTGYQRWSDSYDRDLADVFAVQDEISRAIAEALRLSIASEVPLARRETTNPEAHTLLLRGRAMMEVGTPEAYAEADRLFREALALDPSYARAHVHVADRLMWRAYFRYIPRNGYEEAIEHLDRALELDPELGSAHLMRGHLANMYEWDFARAERHLRRAGELRPGDPALHYNRTWLLMRLGRRDEALRAAERAVELDPLSFSEHNLVGLAHLYGGEPEHSVHPFENALALAPRSPHVLSNYAEALSLLGRHEEAVRMVEEALTLAPGAPISLSAVGRVHARAGDRDRAERMIEELLAQTEYSPYLVARVHAALGDWEAALARLEEAVEARDDHANWIAVSPEFAPLHGDRRFVRMLERVGLAPQPDGA